MLGQLDDFDNLAHRTDPYPAYARLRQDGIQQLADGRWVLARSSEVEAVLAAREAAVGFRPAVPAAGGAPAVQPQMARFSDGVDHDRRRAIAVARIDALDPVDLRAQARELAGRRLHGRTTVEVMTQLARYVPVAVLAEALGSVGGDEDVAAAVAATREVAVAIAPPGGRVPGDPGPAAARLASLLGWRRVGDGLDEEAVNVVALLFQAVDATAGLVGNAVVAAHRAGLALDVTTNRDLVEETNRFDPPVQRTTRVTTAAIEVQGVALPPQAQVVVLLAAANRDPAFIDGPDRFDLARQHRSLAFGAGSRPCPGEEHALALAAGVLDALGDAHASRPPTRIAYEPRANLRIPQDLRMQLTSSPQTPGAP